MMFDEAKQRIPGPGNRKLMRDVAIVTRVKVIEISDFRTNILYRNFNSLAIIIIIETPRKMNMKKHKNLRLFVLLYPCE